VATLETKLRSVHVPLTDAEWEALKIIAVRSGLTLGAVIADALHSTHLHPTTFPPRV
jgi:hypothetical protein